MARWTLIGAVLLACACGSSDDDGGPGPGPGPGPGNAPMIRVLDDGSALRQVSAGGGLAVGPIVLPTAAAITYTVTDMPTGIGADTMSMSIMTAAAISAQRPETEGYALRTGASAMATTPAVGAGTYYLAVACNNIFDPCIFTSRITAFW